MPTPAGLCSLNGHKRNTGTRHATWEGGNAMPMRKTITGLSGSPRVRYAQLLHRLRAKKGITLRVLSDALGWDASVLSRMENGLTLGSPEAAMALDTFYGTGDKLLNTWEMAVYEVKCYREEYRPYMELEAQALSLWEYAPTTMPGLLQTAAYMRESLAASGVFDEVELEGQVEARLERRTVWESEGPLAYRAVLSEAVLRHRLRDDAAWREQLEYVLETAKRDSVIIQVLPFSAGHHGLMNTFVAFLQLPGNKNYAYMENEVRGEVIEEKGTVGALSRAYDAVRDLALNPADSRTFIMRMLEEVPCDPST